MLGVDPEKKRISLSIRQVLEPEVPPPAEEEADQKRILLDEILAFLNGKPVILLATAEITEPDYTIPAIYDGKETELFLWNEETGLSYTWDMADGWLYQSEHTVDELYSFMDSLYG